MRCERGSVDILMLRANESAARTLKVAGARKMAKGTIEVDIKGLKPTQDLHAAACNAVALLNCCPARPLPEVVTVGDAVECDLREPYPHVSRWRLRTPEAVAHANRILATPGSGWRKTPNEKGNRPAQAEGRSA